MRLQIAFPLIQVRHFLEKGSYLIKKKNPSEHILPKETANFLALVSAELMKHLLSLHILKFWFSVSGSNASHRPATYCL